jgi:hypothetical protein
MVPRRGTRREADPGKLLPTHDLLRKNKMEHEFVELPEAGHANYDVDDQVLDWLRSHTR